MDHAYYGRCGSSCYSSAPARNIRTSHSVLESKDSPPRNWGRQIQSSDGDEKRSFGPAAAGLCIPAICAGLLRVDYHPDVPLPYGYLYCPLHLPGGIYIHFW